MTKRLLDFNPLTGEKTWFQFDAHNEQMTITHEQDVSEALRQAKAMANDGDYSKRGIKNDMWHYARVPNTVIIDMKNRFGVDFFNKNHAKRMFELLNTEYKQFKTTEKTHNVRG